MTHIKLKRIYEKPSADDGFRVLVDRLWPRGISKEKAKVQDWEKDLAPSNELRKWFNHQPERWESFTEKYWAELLKNNPGKDFLEKNRTQKTITLIFAGKDTEHSHTIILKEYLEQLISQGF